MSQVIAGTLCLVDQPVATVFIHCEVFCMGLRFTNTVSSLHKKLNYSVHFKITSGTRQLIQDSVERHCIDLFPKRHRMVHNCGFPKFEELYCSLNVVGSTEIS